MGRAGRPRLARAAAQIQLPSTNPLSDQLEKGAEEGGGPGGLRHVALM